MMNKTLLNSPLASKTFVVGGCVRDEILGLPVTDHDFVVEATEEVFRQHFPKAELVGNDFPVFIIDGDEVALTRTERSIGDHYGDFEVTGVGVAIEDDLKRRDFTINAIAKNIVTGKVIDPLLGLSHLAQEAIVMTHHDTFVDDPVRILRAARFAARFEFNLEQRTAFAMGWDGHHVAHATKERIALEVEKVFKQAKRPSIFFKVLADVGALKHVFPELEALRHVPAGPSAHHGDNTAFDHTMEVIDRAKAANAPFRVFMAGLVHDFGKATTPKEILPSHHAHEVRSAEIATEFFEKNRFSKDVKRFAIKGARLHMMAHILTVAKANKLIKRFREVRREEFNDLHLLFEIDHPLTPEERKMMRWIREALFEVKVGDLPVINAETVREAQVRALKERMRS